jgi:exodeoxyribonuclease VII large subunit
MLVESLEPVGEGALKVAFEQIKLKLGKEGLFDEDLKRPLPFFPRRVGVVTSPNGAAFHDILNVLSRRTRTVSIVLIPTRVQGETAGEEIRQAISANEFNRTAFETMKKIDVLIVGRGGGSSEDLWAFNEERVARRFALRKFRLFPPSDTKSILRLPISSPTAARRRRARRRKSSPKAKTKSKRLSRRERRICFN